MPSESIPQSSVEDDISDSPMGIDLQIDVAVPLWDKIPSLHALVKEAVGVALHYSGYPLSLMELSCKFTNNAESQQYNAEYRGQNKPTNVLSFPNIEPQMYDDAFSFAEVGGPRVMLGDVLFAYETIANEAQSQDKTIEHHLSHLIIHGVLHLLGYDHIEEEDAQEMEALECVLLAQLNIDNPYAYELKDEGKYDDRK